METTYVDDSLQTLKSLFETSIMYLLTRFHAAHNFIPFKTVVVASLLLSTKILSTFTIFDARSITSSHITWKN